MMPSLNVFSFVFFLFFEDGFDARKPVNVVLPTAPKASRDYDDFSEKVPKDPPYIAYLSNLPYDVDEDEIAAFFKNMRVSFYLYFTMSKLINVNCIIRNRIYLLIGMFQF